MEINKQHYIVTGGTGQLGSEIVDALVSRGATVSVLDIDEKKIHEIKDSSIDGYVCDLTDPDSIRKSLGAITERHKQVHGLINNVGILYSEPLISIGQQGLQKHSIDSWNNIISVNLTSAFLVTRDVAAIMIKKRTKGVIINISSIVARGNAGQSAYAASKAALESLTVTWARELGPMGVRVAGIAPGYIDVSSTHDALRPDIVKHIKNSTPIRRLGQQAEISEAVISVIENDFINATILPVDGGLVLQ